MPVPPLVALGGSAGAIEALRIVLPTIEPQCEMTLAIVLHRQPVEEDLRLVRVLAARCRLPLSRAVDGEALVAGRVVVCPAGVHLLVRDGHYALSTGAKENGVRPSLDVFFRSAADDLRERVIGVVFSGLLDDGSAGVAAIRAKGGIAIAQDPDEALFADMPRHAIDQGVDAVLPLAEMAHAFERFRERIEIKGTIHIGGALASVLSPFSCPDCHGVLWETERDGATTYRCRTGHAYSPETLQQRQDDSVEDALWAAIRVLEEQADLCERAAARLKKAGKESIAERIESRATRARKRAELVRRALPTPFEAVASAELAPAVDSR